MNEDDKKVIEQYFDIVSNVLTDLNRITPGCSVLHTNGGIQPLIPNGEAGITFQEYFQECAKYAMAENGKYLLLGCEQKIDGKEFLTIVCYSTDPSGGSLSLCGEIFKDPKGTRYTTDKKEWIDQHGQDVDINYYSDE